MTAWAYGPQVMPGQLCSKSNSRRVVMRGRRIAVIKSSASLEWLDAFYRLMPKPEKPFEGLVKLEADVFYADWRRDLDIALLQDALQHHGIIRNDRQVVEIHALRQIDKARPRTVFKVSEVVSDGKGTQG